MEPEGSLPYFTNTNTILPIIQATFKRSLQVGAPGSCPAAPLVRPCVRPSTFTLWAETVNSARRLTTNAYECKADLNLRHLNLN